MAARSIPWTSTSGASPAWRCTRREDRQMELQEIVDTLKRHLAEIPMPQGTGSSDTDFNMWRDRVRDFLEMCFTKDSEEYKRFKGPGSIPNDPIQAHKVIVEAYRGSLPSIIQRLEMRL